MKKITIFLFILIFAVTSSVTSALAASPGEGLRGSDQQILSSTELYAGSGELGLENGAQQDAAFRIPQGIVGLSDGSVIVADTRNHLLRIISQGEVSTFAGMEFLPLGDDGLPVGTLFDEVLELATFHEPVGLASDAIGNIYVADSRSHAIRKVDVNQGEVVTLAGSGLNGAEDGVGEEASFYRPLDLVVSDEGTVYVADTLNHVIRMISPEGEVSTLNAVANRVVDAGEVVFAGGWLDGALDEALFNEPSGMAIDDLGNLYVSDTGNQLIRYIDLAEQTVSTVAGYLPEEGLYPEDELYAAGGFQDGVAEQAQFNFPRGLALTSEGGLVIADRLNHAVRYLHDGQVITISGSSSGEFGNQRGIDASNLLHMPTDVAVMQDGSILIVDAYNNQLKKFSLYELPAGLSSGEINIVKDSTVIELDTSAQIVNDRTMIPLRDIGEAFDYEVNYTESDQRIELLKGEIQIQLEVDSQQMTITTGEHVVEKQLDVAPFVESDRTYVPIRFVTEEFGLDVQWDMETRTVILR